MPRRKKGPPAPLPQGWTLTDSEKKSWRLGPIVGQGGFGLIYLASQRLDAPVSPDSGFVIKVELAENGPLFTELKFYQRAVKQESLHKWRTSHRLDFLGIPAYWGSGRSEYNGTWYRFMVVERLGSDLNKVCERNGGRLKTETVLKLGCRLLHVLEFIHEKEYVHGDIKAANLLLGYRDPRQVYLADYGLSYRYCPDGLHKEYKEDPKRRHDGTIEYTSRDAHKGAANSRRGDLEVLGYCLLHWLCGTLPWSSLLRNPLLVQEAKTSLMAKLPHSVLELSGPGDGMAAVALFLQHVKHLDYKDKPDYQYLRDVLVARVVRKDELLDFSRPEAEQQQQKGRAREKNNSGFGETASPRAARVRTAARGASRPGALPADGKETEADAGDQWESAILQRHKRTKVVPPARPLHAPSGQSPVTEKAKTTQAKRGVRWAKAERIANAQDNDWWTEDSEQENHQKQSLPESSALLQARGIQGASGDAEDQRSAS
uniref:non-specific serine/threonine protein kinase n=1 Tax=Scleropages formosus TaxID=113540 RepID=A0A8C9RLA4_SCLFO